MHTVPFILITMHPDMLAQHGAMRGANHVHKVHTHGKLTDEHVSEECRGLVPGSPTLFP